MQALVGSLSRQVNPLPHDDRRRSPASRQRDFPSEVLLLGPRHWGRLFLADPQAIGPAPTGPIGRRNRERAAQRRQGHGLEGAGEIHRRGIQATLCKARAQSPAAIPVRGQFLSPPLSCLGIHGLTALQPALPFTMKGWRKPQRSRTWQPALQRWHAPALLGPPDKRCSQNTRAFLRFQLCGSARMVAARSVPQSH